jgi:hypothetical protein
VDGVEPAERRDDIEAGGEQAYDLLGAPQHRAVENAVGAESQQLLDVDRRKGWMSVSRVSPS